MAIVKRDLVVGQGNYILDGENSGNSSVSSLDEPWIIISTAASTATRPSAGRPHATVRATDPWSRHVLP